MPQNCLGQFVPYNTPLPMQGDTLTTNTQPRVQEKGPQAQKRKRATSKPEKDLTTPPPGNTQYQKKARPNQEELEVQNTISSPSSQQKEAQPPPPMNSPS